MLNYIWCCLLVVGIVYGGAKAVLHPSSVPPIAQQADAEAKQPSDQHPPVPNRLTALRSAGAALSEATIEAAQLSVTLCISLIGVMALWLGMLQIARDAGMVDALACAMRPLMRWLFPDVPNGHPAQGALLMNLSANMLGLDNAATPFGLQAMRELQTLNPHKETASNAMATFLAINTASITLVPISVIGLRVAAGSSNATAPLAGMVLASLFGTAVALAAVWSLQGLPRYRLAQPSGVEPAPEAQINGPSAPVGDP